MAKTKDIDPRVIQNYLIEKGQLEYAEHFMLFVEETSQLREELAQLKEDYNIQNHKYAAAVADGINTLNQVGRLQNELSEARSILNNYGEIANDMKKIEMENRLLKKTIYDQDQCISVESGRLKQVQHELEAAKKDNEEFKREFTEAMDDVARLGGENEKLQKEIEMVKGVIQKMWFNQIIIRYDSQFDWSTKEYWWQKFKSEHNL